MTSQIWERNSFFNVCVCATVFSCGCTTVFSCVCLYNSFFMWVGMCLAVQGWNRKEGNVFFFLFLFLFLFFSVIRLSAGHWTALQSRWFFFYESCKFKKSSFAEFYTKITFLAKYEPTTCDSFTPMITINYVIEYFNVIILIRFRLAHIQNTVEAS